MEIDTCVNIIVQDIRKNPGKWKDSENLRQLIQSIDFLETHVEEEEEEGLPPMDPEETMSYKKTIKKEFENKNYEKVVTLASTFLENSPNTASIIKLRSKSYWFLKDYENAYYDMCKSQSIDYDDTECELHSEMKDKYESVKRLSTPNCTNTNSCNTETGSESNRNAESLNGLNIDPTMINNIMQQNPELVKMAQNMMSDPEMMNNLLNSMHK